MSKLTLREMRGRRHQRLRKRVSGTAERPRLCVTRSLRHICAQLIDDDLGKTLISASSIEPAIRDKLKKSGTGNQKAAEVVGTVLADRAQEKNIALVVFDRGGNLYHGRVKALAEAARKKGMQF